jgi:hypothetical protein
MSYINPKAAPINTGAAVYQGIQKLAGDVYTFAKEEQTRKGQLISESLAAQQAIDDNVNKMGLSLEEGEDNFEKQIFEQAQAAKQKIAAQYDAMSRTFSSPEQRAKAKAEINKLNKYPEELVADLSTGKYLVDQFNQGLLVEQGQTGSISKTNNLDLLEVIKDMKGGGKNTKMETNAAGARTLVTNVNGKSYKLNISNITNGLKTNPKQMIFNTVSDDSSITKNYQTAMGISGNIDLAALASEGIISKTSKETFAGKPYEIYTINKDALNQRASALSKSLVDDPQNYNYANSIWQDKLGNSVSLREALGERGADNKYKNQEAVLNQIRAHYVDQAIEASGLNKAISAQMPKPEKPKKADKYESDKDLVTLSRNFGKEIPIGGISYKIVGDKGDKSKLFIQAKRTAKVSTTGKIDIASLDYDKENEIPLYNYNEKTKKYSLNYGAFRTLTGSKGIKQ